MMKRMLSAAIGTSSSSDACNDHHSDYGMNNSDQYSSCEKEANEVRAKTTNEDKEVETKRSHCGGEDGI